MERFDPGDADALAELQRSRGFVLLLGRIKVEIERKRSSLEQDVDAHKTAELRGGIRALRTVLEIPTILRDEIGKQLKEE